MTGLHDLDEFVQAQLLLAVSVCPRMVSWDGVLGWCPWMVSWDGVLGWCPGMMSSWMLWLLLWFHLS